MIDSFIPPLEPEHLEVNWSNYASDIQKMAVPRYVHQSNSCSGVSSIGNKGNIPLGARTLAATGVELV